MRRIFVTGIGTDVGKTVVSAILVEALDADYWKPLQAGDVENSDTIKIKNLISSSQSKLHPESFVLSQPMSPHAAAKIDQTTIKLDAIILPNTNNTLIIEGAGGLMVPLNDKDLVIDLIQHLDAEVVLVSQNYLGSINHTLLSISALKSKNLNIIGIVFNGKENLETEKFILNYAGLKCLGRVENHSEINKEIILSYKSAFKNI